MVPEIEFETGEDEEEEEEEEVAVEEEEEMDDEDSDVRKHFVLLQTIASSDPRGAQPRSSIASKLCCHV